MFWHVSNIITFTAIILMVYTVEKGAVKYASDESILKYNISCVHLIYIIYQEMKIQTTLLCTLHYRISCMMIIALTLAKSVDKIEIVKIEKMMYMFHCSIAY